ncbi:MAG: hypothetical protein ABI744_06935 [Chloroflexota bacterium]
MTDEQQPPAPPPPPYEPPPPPSHGPFAFPSPPDSGLTGSGWSPPPEPHGWQPVQRGFFPLDLGRVFELTFSLYRFRWRTLVAIGLLAEIGTAAASLLFLSSPQSTAFSDFTNPPTAAQLNAFLASLGPLLALSVVFFVVFLLLGFIEFGAMTDAIVRIYAGRPVSAWASLRRGFGRWVTFMALMLLLTFGAIAVFLGAGLIGVIVVALVAALTGSVALTLFLTLVLYVAIIAALILFGVRTSMAVPIAMVESLGAMDALRRSWRLVHGSTWRVIGYYLTFWLLVVVASLVVGTVVNIVVNPYQVSGFRIISIDYTKLAISTVLSSVLGAALAPLTTIPAVLLYLDLRVRKGEYINPPGQGSLRSSAADVGLVSEQQL